MSVARPACHSQRRTPLRPRRTLTVVPFAYDIVVVNRAGVRRSIPHTSEAPLEQGELIRLDGRFWIVAEVGQDPGAEPAGGPDAQHEVIEHVLATPARYRIRTRHPDGREEVGAFRRFRSDAPRLGHAFTTVEDGVPESWAIAEERLATDEQGAPYVELVAERDFAEVEDLPDHELEHALARSTESLPASAAEAFDQAAASGLAVELVALEPDEAPDWAEAERFLDALVLEEIEDDLLEQCGVDPGRDPRESWLGRVQERLREDLSRFRADIEGDHSQIEEWDYLDGRIFASSGTTEDEANPDSGHGWLCRLVDAGVLGAAGFSRVRKAEISV